MEEKKAKKIHRKMVKDKMLPDLYSGNWEKDKARFMKSLAMDEKLDLHYDELDFLDNEEDELFY